MTKFWITSWFAFARLPFPIFRVLACALAAILAILVFVCVPERRHVTLANLRLCFPQASRLQRVAWCVQHLYLYLRTFLDRAWLWNGSLKQLFGRVEIVNPQALDVLDHGRVTILLAPHFLGLDAAWSRLSASVNMVTMYSNQKNPILNDVVRKGRERFGQQLLLSRQQGVRPLMQAMKSGRPLYYLPDMDFGDRDSVFVTFFGIPAATVTAVSRLSRLLNAQVIPVTTQFKRGKYFITLHPPLDNLSRENDTESTQAINHHIEAWVAKNRAQYLWLHKRFKTRPPGESKLY